MEGGGGGAGGAATTEPPTIRAISKGVAHRICAGQVIVDLSSAVKELVENSLDAGATYIEVSLKEYGEDWFQVIDNGCGISPNNFKVLALKHHTSKLSDFPDLQSLTSFGFRGEALSSLCALGNLTVETRTKNESIATHLTFDHSGLLTAESKIARQIGTTVTVKKLFCNLPVRSKEFRRNIRKEYGKLISLLNAYGLISKGVRLVCSNASGKNVKSVVLKTQGTGSLKDNIISVLGLSTFSCLEPVNASISGGYKVEGYISKPGNGSGRNLGDRQFLFVNGRPVDMPKVNKLVNELYKVANSRQYPIAIMNFVVPTAACDVNVTPDKRKVFFSDEGSILHSLRAAVENIYSANHVTYSVNDLENPNLEENRSSVLSPDLGRSPTFLKQPSHADSDVKDDPYSKKGGDSGIFITNNNEGIASFSRSASMNKRQSSVIEDFTLRAHGSKRADSFRRVQSEQITGHLNTVSTDRHAPFNSRATKKDVDETIDSSSNLTKGQSSLDNFVTMNTRIHETIGKTITEMPLLRNGPILCQSKESDSIPADSRYSFDGHKLDEHAGVCKVGAEPGSCSHSGAGEVYQGSDISKHFGENVKNAESGEGLGDRENGCPPLVDVGFSAPFREVSKYFSDDLPDGDSPVVQSSRTILDTPSECSKICSPYQFSFDDLKKRRQWRLSRLQTSNFLNERMKVESHRSFSAATLELSEPENEERKAKALAAATHELERLFRKEDFGKMKVIGQFNLGFIIGKINQDLFIVDQHAADEKFNYERLAQSTILNQQPLLRPLSLELSPEEEIVASMHMDTIRKNGFALEEDVRAPPGRRYKLKAVPFSKNIMFGISDVKDLISILADSQGECSILKSSYKMDTTDSVCPPRVRAMLASRACRSSVMIGDALGRNEMQKILEHLADLRSPWNCPHGRPTMRHLVSLTSLRKRSDEDDMM